jgi:alpha-1,6-mannosyltransferase
MPETRRNFGYVGSLVFLFALVLPIFTITRGDTILLLGSYVIAYGAYFFVWEIPNERFLFSLGLVARICLFLTLPILSDDVFRFIWDGHLLKNGIHPFNELPIFYLNQNLPGLNQALFDALNSQTHFTVYPPLNQGIFWLAVTISENWLIATGVIRMFLLASDIGALYFLRKLLLLKQKPQQWAMLYFLNPLLIIEGVGNLHFEGMVIFFLVVGLYYFEKQNVRTSAIHFGLAVGTKLLPLIFLPYFFFNEIRKKKVTFTLVAGLVTVATLLPLYSSKFIAGMKDSLSLYFQQFEFNASIYYIIREIGFTITGYNEIAIIGPALSIASIISIIGISIIGIRKNWPVEKVLLFVLTAHLLLSLTIHPWYILPLIMLGLLSGYVYPLIWSLVIFITYAGYATAEYELSMWFITLEYLIVFLAFIFNKRIKQWVTTYSSYS